MLLVSNIRRSDLTERLKVIYRDKLALLETRATQKSNDNDAVSAQSMAYLVTVSYEATDRAPCGGHRHNRGPRGCIASRSPSLDEMTFHSDALRANGRGMKGRRFRRWRWPWNERARARLDVVERSTEGGYIASVGYALDATKLALNGSTRSWKPSLQVRESDKSRDPEPDVLQAEGSSPKPHPPRPLLPGR